MANTKMGPTLHMLRAYQAVSSTVSLRRGRRKALGPDRLYIEANAFQAGSLGRGILKLLFGGLTIIIALVMFSEPGIALAKLTLFLGVYFIIDGIMVLAGSLSVKPQPGWGWMAFNGAVTLLLAWLILEGWPISGAWAIGILVGVRLLFSGMTMLALGSVGSQAAKEMNKM